MRIVNTVSGEKLHGFEIICPAGGGGGGAFPSVCGPGLQYLKNRQLKLLIVSLYVYNVDTH